MLIVDVNDEGTDSVSDIEGMMVTEINSWQDFEDLYWWLVDNPKKFATVVIDTVSQLQQVLVEEIAAKKDLKGKSAGDWGTLTKSDWGVIAATMKTWLMFYRDLPVEVVFLAQDRVFNIDNEEEVQGTLDPEVGPRLSPSVMSHLCAAVSIIGNTFIRQREVTKKIRGKTRKDIKTEYCFRLGPDASYITKIRKPKGSEIPDVLVDANYQDIISIIQGE